MSGALQDVSQGCQNNHERFMAAVSKSPRALQFASEEVKNNHEIVMAAVSKFPWAFQHASEQLKSNYEFVIAVVSKVPEALEFASEELRGNNEIVMKALSKDWWSTCKCLPKELQAKFQRYQRSPVVILNVVLLSGRCTSMLFSVRSPLHSVLSECADCFGLEPLEVTASGVLLSGCNTIHSLDQLESWQAHDLTLVL